MILTAFRELLRLSRQLRNVAEEQAGLYSKKQKKEGGTDAILVIRLWPLMQQSQQRTAAVRLRSTLLHPKRVIC